MVYLDGDAVKSEKYLKLMAVMLGLSFTCSHAVAQKPLLKRVKDAFAISETTKAQTNPFKAIGSYLGLYKPKNQAAAMTKALGPQQQPTERPQANGFIQPLNELNNRYKAANEAASKGTSLDDIKRTNNQLQSLLAESASPPIRPSVASPQGSSRTLTHAASHSNVQGKPTSATGVRQPSSSLPQPTAPKVVPQPQLTPAQANASAPSLQAVPVKPAVLPALADSPGPQATIRTAAEIKKLLQDSKETKNDDRINALKVQQALRQELAGLPSLSEKKIAKNTRKLQAIEQKLAADETKKKVDTVFASKDSTPEERLAAIQAALNAKDADTERIKAKAERLKNELVTARHNRTEASKLAQISLQAGATDPDMLNAQLKIATDRLNTLKALKAKTTALEKHFTNHKGIVSPLDDKAKNNLFSSEDKESLPSAEMSVSDLRKRLSPQLVASAPSPKVVPQPTGMRQETLLEKERKLRDEINKRMKTLNTQNGEELRESLVLVRNLRDEKIWDKKGKYIPENDHREFSDMESLILKTEKDRGVKIDKPGYIE